jgi:hypothetical protein
MMNKALPVAWVETLLLIGKELKERLTVLLLLPLEEVVAHPIKTMKSTMKTLTSRVLLAKSMKI